MVFLQKLVQLFPFLLSDIFVVQEEYRVILVSVLSQLKIHM